MRLFYAVGLSFLIIVSLLGVDDVEAKRKAQADVVNDDGSRAQLDDQDFQKRRLALHALVEAGAPEAVDTIATHISKETHPVVRRAARDALRRMPLDTAQWEHILSNSPNPQARAAAADVLGHHPATATLDVLQKAMTDTSPAVRTEVYEALARSGDRTLMSQLIRAAAKETDENARATAERSAEYLASGPPSPVEAQTALTQLNASSEAIRTSATRTLAQRQDWRLTPTLQRWIEASAPQQRALAIRAAGDLKDPRMVPYLLTQLPAVGQTQSAIFASLANIGDESATEVFCAHFSDEDAATRRLAVRGLARLQLPHLADTLAPLLDDPSTAVRNELLLALEPVDIKSKQALLLDVLQDAVGPNRASATRQLAEGEPSKVGPAITKLLEDRDVLVRITAAEALGQLGYKPSLAALEKRARRTKNEDERAYYLQAIAQIERL